MKARLVRVVGALFQRRIDEAAAGLDRVIVAHQAIAVQHRRQQGFAVDRVLHRQAHVVVLEHLAVGEHREGVVLGALGFLDDQVRVALEQRHGLEVDLVDHVHLPGDQCIDPCRAVGNGDQLGAGEVCPSCFPVVRAAFQVHAHARLEVLETITAGADA
ncbi:hypothetical protein D3C79_793060 [compost metagenome]